MAPGDDGMAQTYVPIDALAHGMEANIFGVVVWMSPPMATRGPDLMLQMRLVDESTQTGVHVMFFRTVVPLLPDVRSVGDVVRLHRMKIHAHNGQTLQALSDKRSTVAVVGADSDPSAPPRVPPVRLL